MPGGSSKLRDVRKLAETRAEFQFDIPVTQLPGIPADVSAASETVHARLRFSREQGLNVAEVALRGDVELTCQRCMQRMRFGVDTSSRVAVVNTETEADAVPAQWDTFLAAEGCLSLAALAAEELLLALPIVPLHAPEDGCATPSAPIGSAAADTKVQVPQETAMTQPFAQLRAMLERGTNSK
jgi:uncharacterized protein